MHIRMTAIVLAGAMALGAAACSKPDQEQLADKAKVAAHEAEVAADKAIDHTAVAADRAGEAADKAGKAVVDGAAKAAEATERAAGNAADKLNAINEND